MDAIYRNRGCITDVREERERKTLAVGAAQERRTASTPPAGAAPAARLRHGFAAVCAALALLCPAPAQAGDDYDALILRARAGDHQPALAMLCALGRRRPRASRTASWWQLGGPARRGDADLRATARRARSRPPTPVGGGAALRDLRRWPEALAQFRAGMRAYPSQPAFAAGIAMTLADADRLDEALAAGEQLVRARPGTRTPLALAYVHARRNTPFEALRDRPRARPDARRRVCGTRVCVRPQRRMAGAALTHATRRPELYTEAQMRRLQADALAEQVRLASMPTRNEADRFAIADRVLARYDALIPAWSTQGDETRDDVIRARIDRLHRAARALRAISPASTRRCAPRAWPCRATRWAMSLPPICTCASRSRPPPSTSRWPRPRKATTTIRWTGWATRPAATTAGRGRGFRRRLAGHGRDPRGLSGLGHASGQPMRIP